ncbi:hypothetical protein VTK73DRAFT_2164 [Phialemonium thermophilum]|uniref:Uncharacterized protein n=1 Tax=Phialemonium thermophilum TaxID=223376 RepID=A0ABR3X5T0_9PEZI
MARRARARPGVIYIHIMDALLAGLVHRTAALFSWGIAWAASKENLFFSRLPTAVHSKTRQVGRFRSFARHGKRLVSYPPAQEDADLQVLSFIVRYCPAEGARLSKWGYPSSRQSGGGKT